MYIATKRPTAGAVLILEVHLTKVHSAPFYNQEVFIIMAWTYWYYIRESIFLSVAVVAPQRKSFTICQMQVPPKNDSTSYCSYTLE